MRPLIIAMIEEKNEPTDNLALTSVVIEHKVTPKALNSEIMLLGKCLQFVKANQID